MATATGCLYFLDPSNIANNSGLEAVGIVLLILNIGYVLVMLVLIVMTGAHKTKHFTRTAFAVLKTTSFKLKHSVSGLSSTSSVSRLQHSVSGLSKTSSVSEPKHRVADDAQ